MQDSKGYLWFSTEAGVCRFDGDEIKVYSANKGLPENSCYGMCEFPAGNLWFITSSNRVMRYDEKNDSLVEAGFNSNLKKYTASKKFNSFYSIQPESDSTLWISARSENFSVNFKNQNVVPKQIPVGEHYFIKTPFAFLQAKNMHPWMGRSDTPPPVLFGAPVEFFIIQGKDTIPKQIAWTINEIPQWRILTAKNNSGDCYIGWDNKVIRIKKDNTLEIYTVSTAILSIYTDTDNGLWVGTSTKGVLYFQHSELVNPIVSLPQLSVTGICVDGENGVWCTTIEKGIYYCRSKHIIDYSNVKGLDQRPTLFKLINGQLFFSSLPETVFKVKDQSIENIQLNFTNGFGLTDICFRQSGYLLSSAKFVASADISLKNFTTFKAKDGSSLSARKIEVTEEGRMFFLQYAELLELINGQLITYPVTLPSGCTTLFSIGSNQLLLGCKDGLYLTDIVTHTMEKIVGIDGTVVSIVKDEFGIVWVASSDKGLYLLEGKKLRTISDSLKLQDMRFFALATDRNNVVWAGSNKGLVKIDMHRKKVAVFTTLDGLPSREVYKVACSNDRVYFATGEGLASLGLEDDLHSGKLPALYIGSIRINGKLMQADKEIVLTSDENFLTVQCEIPAFKNTDGAKLMYMLTGNYKRDAFFSNERTVKLDNLSPGKYVLYLYAVQHNKAVGLPKKISFEILPPFWKTTWFISVVAVIFFTLLYFSISLYIRRIKHREAEKTKINNLIAESQLTALQAQMNPHFIFNAINSIQRYVLEKNKHEAYDYLARFSRLIRMVLNNSEEKILPLQKEIETISLYVELEQLRFKNSFAFEINVDPDLDIYQVHVPTMLIQPYIENAIWHGLMTLEKEQHAKLSLTICMKENILGITIEDNGIGRKKAQEYAKLRTHKSVAMNLTEQRLKMINKMKSYEGARVVITDLEDENKNALGTRVEIILPIHLEN